MNIALYVTLHGRKSDCWRQAHETAFAGGALRCFCPLAKKTYATGSILATMFTSFAYVWDDGFVVKSCPNSRDLVNDCAIKSCRISRKMCNLYEGISQGCRHVLNFRESGNPIKTVVYILLSDYKFRPICSCKYDVALLIKHGIVLTGRNSTGPPSRAAPWWVTLQMRRVADADRRQTTMTTTDTSNRY